MSPDGRSEMEQLDALAVELGEAGRIARLSTAQRGRPDGVFTMRLRSELLQSFGSIAVADGPLELIGCQDSVDSAAATAVSGVPGGESPIAGPIDVQAGFRPLRSDAQPFSRRTARAVPLAVADSVADEGSLDHAGSEPTKLRPSISWHIPTRAMPSRWVGVGLAACLALAAFMVGSGVLWPVKPPARADDAIAATLIRGPQSTALTVGTDLSQGDEIRVAADGRAYLALGSSYVRLDGGADIRLDSLDANDVEISQLAGRVYHRVQLPDGGRYRVRTGDVVWQAAGTAFDLDRESSAGGEQVLGLALQHDVQVSAPGYSGAVLQGSSAVFLLNAAGSASGSPAISAIPVPQLTNAWLILNAGLDARLGLPLGELADLATPTPNPSATSHASPEPTASPTPSPSASDTATPAPTPTPASTTSATPKPTAIPTSRHGSVPNLGNLSITHNSNGTYSFSWPRYTGSGFQWYKLIYGPWGSQPTFNGSNYWACNSSASETSWTGGITPGDYSVRLQVIDESSGRIIVRAQTGVVRLTVVVPATVSLGNLSVVENADGTYTFTWARYDATPFSYYKLVYGPVGSNPSYPKGSPYWAVPSSDSTSVTLIPGVDGFGPGDWAVRIQAIGYPSGAAYAYAQTYVYHLYVAPAPTPTPPATPTPTPTPEPTPTPTPTPTA
jgi:hypothetical protein